MGLSSCQFPFPPTLSAALSLPRIARLFLRLFRALFPRLLFYRPTTNCQSKFYFIKIYEISTFTLFSVSSRVLVLIFSHILCSQLYEEMYIFISSLQLLFVYKKKCVFYTCCCNVALSLCNLSSLFENRVSACGLT